MLADGGDIAVVEQMEQGSITQVLFSDILKRIAVLNNDTQELIADELETIVSSFEGKKEVQADTMSDMDALESAQHLQTGMQ